MSGKGGLGSLFGLNRPSGAPSDDVGGESGIPPIPPAKPDPPKKKGKTSDGIVVESGFDPSALERGAKAMRELDASPNGKAALELAATQERTRQIEMQAAIEQQKANAAQAQAMGAEKVGEEERKSISHREEQERRTAQYKAQLQQHMEEKKMEEQKKMEAERLARQDEQFQRHEEQRLRNEQRIEESRRNTAAQQAELDRETQAARVAAKGKLERENHDVRLAMMRAEQQEQRVTRLETVREQMRMFGEGARDFISDPAKVTMSVGALTALAFGVYTARTSTSVLGRYIEKTLGKPSLVRETSRATTVGSAASQIGRRMFGAAEDAVMSNVVLKPELHQRMQVIAAATKSTRRNNAPFRHVLLHGPPGCGKTLYAKNLAHYTGMDYAIMTGADVAPLGADAVTEMHKLFDWAQTSNKGLLLFIDEADAFLRKGRQDNTMSESMRNVLSAFLYRTGTETDRFALVFATNEPQLLDQAVLDRVDEIVEFPVPGPRERELMLKDFYRQYLAPPPSTWKFWQKQRAPIDCSQLGEEQFGELAAETDGWSGRQLAKLAISVQARVYGGGGQLTMDSAREALRLADEGQDAVRRFTGI